MQRTTFGTASGLSARAGAAARNRLSRQSPPPNPTVAKSEFWTRTRSGAKVSTPEARWRKFTYALAASTSATIWPARFCAGIRVSGAMLALFRNIQTNEPQAVSRTFLDRTGRKLGRKFCGPVGGAAVKVEADENVTHGLHVGEGVETCLAARQLRLRPTWAVGSKGAIATFPVLPGIQTLTILAEPDAEKEIEACATRWHAASREVLINRAIGGKDLNDAIKRVR